MDILIRKEKIIQFEKKVAKLANRKFACAVSSGTAALEIAVKSLKINKNHEIIMHLYNYF